MEESTKQKMILELSRNYVSELAPQELPLFRAQSEAYFKDPRKALTQEGGKDELLGFGAGEVVTFLTPIAIAVTSDVFEYLLEELKKNLKSEGSVAVGDLVKKLFKKLNPQPGDQPPPAALQSTPSEQPTAAAIPDKQQLLSKIHKLALDKARQLKLSEAKAAQLADAIVADLALSD